MSEAIESSHPAETIVPQDLYWDEAIAAIKLAPSYTDFKQYRYAIVNEVFTQSSFNTRFGYAAYIVKWFLPDASFDGPSVTAWRAFGDDIALQHVMRWQYVTSNPIFSGFVDGPLSSAEPGQIVDGLIDAYLISLHTSLKERTRSRVRANLRKIGLLFEQKKSLYRFVPEVSPKAIAVLLACLFAPEPQVVSWATLVGDPWWRRLGIIDTTMLRAKLHETATMGLINDVVRMDTLDQITTRYSLSQFQSGEVRRK